MRWKSVFVWIIKIDGGIYEVKIIQKTRREKNRIGENRPGHGSGLFTGSAHGLGEMAGRVGLTRVLCCCFFCIFDSFRLKKKGNERSAHEPANAGSCQCGLEIKCLDCDRPTAHVADNGPGRASSGLMLGRTQIVLDRAGPHTGPTHAHLQVRSLCVYY